MTNNLDEPSSLLFYGQTGITASVGGGEEFCTEKGTKKPVKACGMVREWPVMDESRQRALCLESGTQLEAQFCARLWRRLAVMLGLRMPQNSMSAINSKALNPDAGIFHY